MALYTERDDILQLYANDHDRIFDPVPHSFVDTSNLFTEQVHFNWKCDHAYSVAVW